jgi:hypothetical protein
MLADLATVAVTAAFAAPILLVTVYSIVAPWWRSQIGRTLVTAKAAVALALLPPFLHRITGNGDVGTTPAFNVFISVTWGVLALVLLRMTWVIVATQWRARRPPAHSAKAEMTPEPERT